MFGAAPAAYPEDIEFLLLPDFSMMAFTSSVEPLRAANLLSGRELYRWRTLSIDGDPVIASNGVELIAAGGLADAGSASTLFVCAGIGAERFRDERVWNRLRVLARKGVALGGVCTGALALARAGLLNDCRCTIHWENVEGFAEEFPELDITATMFEADRKRYTCSGGTAPLDMMINSIALDHGDDLAVNVAELLLHTSVRHPHDMQRMPLEHRTGITHPKLLAVIAHMEAYVESPVPVHELAETAGLSSRQLERLFRERLGTTPSRYYLELRLQRARLLLRQTTMSVLQIAVASGFASASHFTRSYHAFFDKTPREERRVVERVPH
jgi:transcriptional regulator GlxA family with amidase domain